MSMRYKIYPERRLLVDVVEGHIDMEGLKKLFLHEISDDDFKGVNKVLSVVTDADLDFSPAEFREFIQFISSPEPDPTFRWAILARNPKQTALSFLIREDQMFSPLVGVFSTLTACIHYLNVPYESNELNDKDFHHFS